MGMTSSNVAIVMVIASLGFLCSSEAGPHGKMSTIFVNSNTNGVIYLNALIMIRSS